MDLIEQHVPNDIKSSILSLLSNVFSSTQTLQQKIYLSLMPTEISIHDKTIKIDYKIIQYSLQKRVMLILTNVTDRKNLEIQAAEERKNLAMIVKAIAKKSDVKLAIEEFKHFIHKGSQVIITSATEPATELYRLIRIHKNDFAQLGLHNTVKTLDEMEDFLAAMRLLQPNEQNKAVLETVVTTWNAYSVLQNDMLILTNALGKDFFDKYQRLYISNEKLLEAERNVEAILTGEERNESLQQLRSLRYNNLKDLLSQYECYVRVVAKHLIKHVELIITGDNLLVDINLYSYFIKSLAHIFRNMIDYGIESTEERVSAGKQKIGKIHCHITNMDSYFVLGIFNDGYSHDNEKIYRKAIEKSIIGPEDTTVISHKKIYEMLLMTPLSIKDNVTMISGKRVDFPSVKTELNRLGGKIRIRSEMEKDTGFEFLIPLTQHHQPALASA